MTTHLSLYPNPSHELLRERFLGKSLRDVETPAAVIDLSIVKRNCQKMLDAVDELGFSWRAHIKTHKTTELTRLQLGPDLNKPANIIVSTIIEAESILPLLLTYPRHNLLYGLPPGPSSAQRLILLQTSLGPNGLSLLIDHPSQLPVIQSIHSKTGIAPLIFIKIDMGGHRAGVPPRSETSTVLFKAVLEAHLNGFCILHGLYSHAGHSYGSDSEAAAMDFLNQELKALLEATREMNSLCFSDAIEKTVTSLVLSVGATPTTTSIRNLLSPTSNSDPSSAHTTTISKLQTTLASIKNSAHIVELHAGVYPLLDMQQLATSALPAELFSTKDIGLTILAEVLSLYPDRTEKETVLVGAGSLALGRETSKAYDGYGILTPWNLPPTPSPSPTWKISYISQEHGLLTPITNLAIPTTQTPTPAKQLGIANFEVGQKVRIWPNHACIASSQFGWYLVVDSESGGKGSGDVVVDIWVRFRGW